MFVIISILLFVGILVSRVFDTKQERKDNLRTFHMIYLFIMSLIICLILVFINSCNNDVDSVINLYKEENTVIKHHMYELLQDCNDCKLIVNNNNSIEIVTYCNEAKDNKLVQKQIALYYKNVERIEELEERYIYRDFFRYLLYFGGNDYR